MSLDFADAHKKRLAIGAAAIAVLATLWIAIGIEAATVVAVLGGLVVVLGYASLRQEQVEEAHINVTTPGGVPLAPVQPEIAHVNHLLHLVLSILTSGLWLIVWILLTINVKSENDRLQRRYRAAMRRYSAELAAYEEKKRSGQ